MEFRNPKKLEKSKDIDESDEKQGNPGDRRGSDGIGES
jgi:hypothetical protein